MDASSDKPTPSEELPPSLGTPVAGDKDTSSTIPKDIVDAILNFFATSSNEVLLGAFAALIVATYIILGRLGLLLIGVAGGVTLHASWETSDNGSAGGPSEDRNSRRKELALHVANRLLDWRQRTPESDESANDSEQKSTEITSPIDFDSISGPETAAALQTLTDAVIRDYVKYWYGPILPSDTKFPLSCRRVLTGFIGNVSSRLSRKRTADAFLEFLTNSSSMVIVFLNELSTAYQVVGTSMTPEQTVRRYLELSPESSLANVLAETQQKRKLNMIADDVLSNFLDPKAYDCPPVRDFLREILAGVILESIVSSLSRPEFINGWIIYLCSEGESEIMNAIDAGVESARTQGVSSVKDATENTITRASTDAADADPNFADIKQVKSANVDKATEDAIKEAKRLSAMIAAQSNLQEPVSTTDLGERYSKSSDELGRATDGGRDSLVREATEKAIGETSLKKETTLSDATASSQSPAVLPNSSSSPSLPSDLPPPLHGASISVDDASEPGGKGLLRSKPTSEYLLQVEPPSSRATGWMVFRKYTDFESLHVALETISRLNRIEKFAEDHPLLPPWKGQTKQGLVKELEGYLHDALQYEPLAESARMRRFLEKDAGPSAESNGTKSGFSFPSQNALENVGRNVLGVLSNAPKGVSGGSKAVFGGVSGVFGTGTGSGRKPLASPDVDGDAGKLAGQHGVRTPSIRTSEEDNPYEKAAAEWDKLDASAEELQSTKLSHTTDSSPRESTSSRAKDSLDGSSEFPASAPEAKVEPALGPSSGPNETATNGARPSSIGERPAATTSGSRSSPITQEETRIAVELIFAVINELYTLSSAWNIRRTLLNAAKSYILRPGNPNLETIRGLLQESMIEANTTDDTIAYYLLKMRENALPTEEELKAWPPPPDDAEKERLRDSARKALVQRGLPQALTSVMGAAASREALEKVFDCLQYEPIARGFVFSVLLQALRAVIL